jgi:hypothetical protein
MNLVPVHQLVVCDGSKMDHRPMLIPYFISCGLLGGRCCCLLLLLVIRLQQDLCRLRIHLRRCKGCAILWLLLPAVYISSSSGSTRCRSRDLPGLNRRYLPPLDVQHLLSALDRLWRHGKTYIQNHLYSSNLHPSSALIAHVV